jgi:hypothetical protein
MAQDLYAAFHLGEDNRHIDTIDSEGLALVSIQALKRELDGRVAALNQRLNRRAPTPPIAASSRATLVISTLGLVGIGVALLALSTGLGAALAVYLMRRNLRRSRLAVV